MRTLFVNGVFYSPEKLKADCLAVYRGQIVDIGTRTQLINLRRRGYKVVDLKKRTVLPGFIDSHVHLLSTGYSLLRLDLSSINSLEKAVIIIEKAAKKLSSGQWLIGSGWDKNLWGIQFPDKTILDKICPDNPVKLSSKDGHAVWVNSAALQLCGIDANTSDSEGGAIKKYPDGSPTGILLENAIGLISEKIPQPTNDFKIKALKKAIKKFNQYGITGVGDCDGYSNRLDIFQTAQEKGLLNLRVFMMLSSDDLDSAVGLGVRTGFGDGLINIGALKLYMDGSLGSQTALMHSSYENQPDNFGIRTLSNDELEMYFEKAHIKNIALAVHAIGDKANSELLKFFGKKYAVSQKLGLLHRIEHAQHLRKEDIPKFRKYNVAAAIQPIHLTADRDMAEKHLGERAKLAYPFNSLLKGKAKVGFGSDSPIENPNPFIGIYAAVTRKNPADNEPGWNLNEAVSLKQAIEAYTAGSAQLCKWQNKCGALTIGAKADFTVISDDIFKIGPEKIPNMQVLATVFNGQIVYTHRNFKL